MQQFDRVSLLTHDGELVGVKINGHELRSVCGVRFEADAEQGLPYRVVLTLAAEIVGPEAAPAAPGAAQEEEAPALPPVFGRQNPQAGDIDHAPDRR